MERSQNSELTRRINQAFTLLKQEVPTPQIVTRLSSMFGISRVQAYRYLKQAKANKGPIPIPEDAVVFTVKLQPGLIKRIKRFAHATGMSISKVVRVALEDFLAQRDHGQGTETS